MPNLPRLRTVWRTLHRWIGLGLATLLVPIAVSGALLVWHDHRWIHEGSHSGPIWQFVVFLTGIFPLVFAATGVIMWWRGSRSRREIAANCPARGELQAAE